MLSAALRRLEDRVAHHTQVADAFDIVARAREYGIHGFTHLELARVAPHKLRLQCGCARTVCKKVSREAHLGQLFLGVEPDARAHEADGFLARAGPREPSRRNGRVQQSALLRGFGEQARLRRIDPCDPKAARVSVCNRLRERARCQLRPLLRDRRRHASAQRWLFALGVRELTGRHKPRAVAVMRHELSSTWPPSRMSQPT